MFREAHSNIMHKVTSQITLSTHILNSGLKMYIAECQKTAGLNQF